MQLTSHALGKTLGLLKITQKFFELDLFPNPMKLILLGPPGSGKGTIAQKLQKEFGWEQVSAGELLREEVKQKTTIGRTVQKYMEKGDLVPNRFVVELMKLAVMEKKNFIWDGFPRSIKQAAPIKDIPINLVIFVDVPEKNVVERFSGRRVCPQGHGYHIKYLPPKKMGICDKDKLPLKKRKDDNPKVIKERFKVYHQETQPLIAYYKKKGLLKIVDGSPPPKEVYAAVQKLLKET
jgi:adenylate kinase